MKAKRWSLVFGLWTLVVILGYGQTVISGKVSAKESEEEMIGANVVFYQSGVYKAGISTDFDGNYQLEIEAGIYDVEASYIGYPTLRITGVFIEEENNNVLNLKLEDYGQVIGCPIYPIYPIYHYPVKLFDRTNTSSGLKIDAYEIEQASGKNISDIISSTPGVSLGY